MKLRNLMKRKVTLLGFLLLSAALLLTPAFAGNTALAVSAPDYVKAGEVFAVEIMLQDAVDVRAVEFNLQFDPTKVEIVKKTGSQYFQGSSILSNFLFFSQLSGDDTVTLAAALQGDNGTPLNFTGQQTLGKIYFKAIADGETNFNFAFTEILDFDYEKVVHIANGASTVIDGVGPMVDPIYPVEGETIYESKPTITADVYDETTGVKADSLKLFVDGNSVPLAGYSNNEASFKLADELEDGQHLASLVAEDMVGNQTTYDWNFTTDTQAPPAPVISSIPTIIYSGNQVQVSIEGTTKINTTVKLEFTDETGTKAAVDAEVQATGQFVAVADLSTLLDGDIRLQAWAFDKADRSSDPTEVILFKDTVAEAPELNVDSINSSNQQAVSFNGTAEVNSFINISFSDSQTSVNQEVYTNETGVFQDVVDLSTLSDGEIEVKAILADAYGNVSQPGLVKVLKDTEVQVSMARHDANKPLIIGDKLTITVFGEIGLTANYAIGSGESLVQGSLTELDAGFYSVEIPITADTPELKDGAGLVQLTFVDASGNQRVIDLPAVIIITSKPEILSITHSPNKVAFKAGEELQITMEGTAGQKATVDIGNFSVGQPMVEGENGIYTFTYTVPANVNGESIKIKGYLEDIAGNKTEMTDLNTVSFDTISPKSTYKLDPKEPNGFNGWYKANPTKVRLISESGATIHYQVDGGELLQAPSPVEIDLTTDGTHTIDYYAVDLAGNQEVTPTGTPNRVTVKVKVSKPNQPVIIPDDYNPKGESTTVKVTTDANNYVEIYRKNWKIDSGFANEQGEISFSVPLREGSNELTARARDYAGNFSDYSDLVTLIKDTKGPKFSIDLSENGGEVTVTILPSEPLKDNTFNLALVSIGEGTPQQVQLNPQYDPETGAYTGSFTLESPASIKINLIAYDENGNKGVGAYTKKIVVTGQATELNDDAGILIPAGAYGAQQFAAKADGIEIYAATKAITEQDLVNISEHEIVNVMEFGPSQQFNNDVFISLKYAEGLDPQKLGIYYWNGTTQQWENWQDKIVSIDTENRIVTFKTNHFSTFGLFADNTPPGLELNLPDGQWITKETAVDISGTTEPAATVKAMIGGEVKAETTADANGNFILAGVNLSADVANIVEVVAADNVGNESKEDVTIIQDSTGPQLEVTQPDILVTKENVITVAGTSDLGAEVTLQINDGDTVSLGTSGNFNTTVTLEQEGANTLYIKATDLAGNSTEQNLTVTKDTTPPPLQISNWQNGMTTTNKSITLEGLTEEGATLSITNNGIPVGGPIIVDGNSFSQEIADLSEGTNEIIISARDAVGNEAFVKLTLEYDTSVPELIVTNPTQGSIETNQGSYTLKGWTNGATLTMIVENSENQNPVGILVPVQDGQFSVDIDLAPGQNKVTLTASNDNGNSEVMVEINYVIPGGTVRGKIVQPGAWSEAGATVTVTNGDNSYSVQTDDQGNYEVTGINPGTYKVVAKKNGYLPAEVTSVQVNAGEIALVDLSLLYGNFVQDNIIKMNDLLQIVQAYGISKTNPKWNDVYDYYHDGLVKMNDILAVLKNYGKMYISK